MLFLSAPSTTFSAFQVLKHSISGFFHAFYRLKIEKSSTPSASSSTPSAYLYSKEWANNQLKIAIEFLKEGAKSEGFWLWNQRLGVVILIKTELEFRGFKWQVARIDNWIHRLQPRKADLDRERERRAH